MSNSFYVVLPSNSPSFPNNTTADFRVALPKALHFDSDYVVGLHSIVYPISWASIGAIEPQAIGGFTVEGHDYPDAVQLARGVTSAIGDLPSARLRREAETPAELADKVNRGEVLDNPPLEDDSSVETPPTEPPAETPTEPPPSATPRPPPNESAPPPPDHSPAPLTAEPPIVFEFDSVYQRIRARFRNPRVERVVISAQLAYALGFAAEQTVLDGTLAKYSPALDGGINSILIYSDNLIEPQIIGDRLAPLLRMVTVNGRPGEVVEQIFNPTIFARLRSREVNNIHIQVRTDSGDSVPYEWGTVVVTLCFKREPIF
ncbi:hypothetical protein M3Y99_01425800 [Aphelenchoides fujianensis]|nr:hypothetical protein M3Y99_01425800 [Aphelenchoides fujianensis]